MVVHFESSKWQTLRCSVFLVLSRTGANEPNTDNVVTTTKTNTLLSSVANIPPRKWLKVLARRSPVVHLLPGNIGRKVERSNEEYSRRKVIGMTRMAKGMS